MIVLEVIGVKIFIKVVDMIKVIKVVYDSFFWGKDIV